MFALGGFHHSPAFPAADNAPHCSYQLDFTVDMVKPTRPTSGRKYPGDRRVRRRVRRGHGAGGLVEEEGTRNKRVANMLHEVLLALSGHPSPLFRNPEANATADPASIHSLLSPSEAALLRSIGKLAERHRELRDRVRWIESKHRSTICRAVAIGIQSHLARLQQKILDVESKILTKDASVVGAYDIVPLALIVTEFDDWHRLMEWIWATACLMQAPTSQTGTLDAGDGCSGATVINYLRAEANTGFSEIEKASTELSRIAELAWLRQLAPWIVYGKLPAFGAGDFFVQAAQGDDVAFRVVKELIPDFLAAAAVSSILFIGTCLHQIQRLPPHSTPSVASTSHRLADTKLAPEHLQHLSSLPLPMNQIQLTRAISTIRLSLSQNVLQRLLPMRDITRLLRCLRSYFLLGHGEFAIAIIEEAEARLQARQQSMGRLLRQDPLKALQDLSIKDTELHQTLSSAWKRLAREDYAEDMVLSFARQHMRLSLPNAKAARPASSGSVSRQTPQISSIAFNDLLFPSATTLGIDTGQPLDLFISPRDIETYAAINAYLLAVRRAQVRLSELWRRTSARRDRTIKKTVTNRRRHFRKVWATSSAALHLVSETAAYLEGEVVKGSCDLFECWVEHPTSNESLDDSFGSVQSTQAPEVAQRDPETLAAAHRTFVASLSYSLLLTDVPYTRDLRSLLGNSDALIAFFNSLLDAQQKADLADEAISGGDGYTADEESRLGLELDRARKKVDSDLRSVVRRLRELDHERIGAGRYLEVDMSESGGFEPWRGGGVNRLLMKLEFERVADEDARDLE
ncbi:hypothetical protein LTR82_008961 [Friedmanniomyces endolithicus]|uniref:Spindle pole body component n=1 Tax=Friedmanniomyces endolithicus TaxID=329885 RepID=A0AAN6J7C7_9PEZI|nr:hypothetical protein LTR82_008961 [Friedmanniomyces endolithicus]